MNVKIVRLTSGEEIIANITETDDSITIKDGAVLIPSPEGKLLLAKWLPYAVTDNGVTLDKKNLVFAIDPQKELLNHYTTVVVNNLVVPGKKIVDGSGNSNLKLTV
jgi:hypothetical protein